MVLANLPSDLHTEIATFLDLTSTCRLSATCRALSVLLKKQGLWKSMLKRNPETQQYYVGTLFNFQTIPGLASLLHSNIEGIDPSLLYAEAVHGIKTAEHIVSQALQASTHDWSQDLSCTLNFNDPNFWSSRGSVSKEADEWCLFEFYEVSMVYAVQFAVYRAGYQGGYLYPPQRVRVKLRLPDEKWHYISEEFSVEFTEEPQTVLILPEIVFGKYVCLECLGKVTPQPGDEQYYTTLSYFTCIGKPLSTTALPSPSSVSSIVHRYSHETIQEFLDSQYTPEQFSQFVEFMTPWIASRLRLTPELKLVCERFLQGFMLNRIMSIVYVTRLLTPDQLTRENLSFVEVSEAIGSHVFKQGSVELAGQIFINARCIKGYIACLIVRSSFRDIESIITDQSPRLPSFAEIWKMANDLGRRQQFAKYFRNQDRWAEQLARLESQ